MSEGIGARALADSQKCGRDLAPTLSPLPAVAGHASLPTAAALGVPTPFDQDWGVCPPALATATIGHLPPDPAAAIDEPETAFSIRGGHGEICPHERHLG